MGHIHKLDLAAILDHGNPDAVLEFTRDTFAVAFPKTDFSPVPEVFALTRDLYEGRFPGYAACRTSYHDFRHTLDVLVAAIRLLDGGILSGHPCSAELAKDLCIAALLHDCGYIQEASDSHGTGARHTKTHVARSAAFVKTYADKLQLSGAQAKRIGSFIMATDLALEWEKLEYANEQERYIAAILAAADLLGQMADRQYLEKLLFLYYEFREAGIGEYQTAFDILRKTSFFYQGTVDRLDGALGFVSHYTRPHFAGRCGVDRDLYRESIQRQMTYLLKIMDDDTVNFRKRLRRGNLEEMESMETRRLKSFGVVF